MRLHSTEVFRLLFTKAGVQTAGLGAACPLPRSATGRDGDSTQSGSPCPRDGNGQRAEAVNAGEWQ